MKPLLRFSPLSGRVMLLTRYTVRDTHLIAHTKYDVTEQYLAIDRRVVARAQVTKCRAMTKPTWYRPEPERCSLAAIAGGFCGTHQRRVRA